MLPLKRILCPTDFSDFSYDAIEKGVELAKHFGAELCVLYVTPALENTPALTPFQDFVGVDSGQLETAAWNHAERKLVELIKRHHLSGVRVRSLIRRGLPAEEIVSVADEEKSDLIVIATHGLTGWRHQVFGSVAEEVLRRSRCPVLVTRVLEAQGE